MQNTARKIIPDDGGDGQQPSALEKFRQFIEITDSLTLKEKKLLSSDLIAYLQSEFIGEMDKIRIETRRITNSDQNYRYLSMLSGLLHNVILEIGYKSRKFEPGQREDSWGYHTFSWNYDFKIIRTLTSIRLDNILILERFTLKETEKKYYIESDREEKTPRLPDFRGKITPLELSKKVKLIDLLTSEFGLTADRAEEAYASLRSDFFVASKSPIRLLSIPETDAVIPSYKGKGKSGDIIGFLRRHFPHREGAPTLTMAYLKETDTKAYQAFINKKRRSSDLPADVQLPTRSELNDAFLREHKIDLSSREGRTNARKLMGVINGRLKNDR